MTPFPQCWTVFAILMWTLFGWGVCCVVTGTLIVFGPYEVARDVVIGIVKPVLVLTSWSWNIYIDSDPRVEDLTVASTTFASTTFRGVQFNLRAFGQVVVATGNLITVIAWILIQRAKTSAAPIDPAQVN